MAVAREESFGARLRRLRETAGLTQEALAQRAGLSPNAVSALERGVRRRPYPHTVRALADALGLSEEERDALTATAPRRTGMAFTPSAGDGGMLPAPATTLLGRERELAEVGGLLAQPEVRLLTLVGTGGVGKTRLALEASRASLAAGRFPDGVYFVDLGPFDDAVLVLSAVSQALGLRTGGDQPLLEVLLTYLRGRRLLLVLDNFEHLPEAAPEVAGLVGSCPDLTVLVTSRAPLSVRGERRYLVPPLGLPDPAGAQDAEVVAAAPAARLFVERAGEVSPSFELTRENTASVATICRRLEGLPLALELAAAKVGLLGPAALLSRLDQALETGGARDLPERQQTIRATLRWSHDLLSESEKYLFRRLSMFVGGFSLDAAEAVGVSREVEVGGVLRALERLVEQSLVLAVPDEGGVEARYRMLEPVRHYALKRLEEARESAQARRRHAEFFLALAERAEPLVHGPAGVEWLNLLEKENGNLRAAMGWALSTEDAELAARLGWTLWMFWWYRGHQREGRRWIEAVLRREFSPASRAKVLMVAGSLSYGHGDYQQSERYCEECLELSRRVGDEIRAAWAQVGLGLVAMSRADHGAAASNLEAALRSFREADEDYGVALVFNFLGILALVDGGEDEATRKFEQGLAMSRKLGDRPHAYIALYNLAQVALSRGDHDGAAALLREGISLSEQIGDRANLAYCIEGLAVVAGLQGQAERCACLVGAAERLHEAVGVPVYVYYEPYHSLYESTVAAARSRLGEEAFEEARAAGRTMTLEQAVEYADKGQPGTDGSNSDA